MEAAKKRADDLLHEELRQKKEVLEANDLAMRTEEKRLSEKIRILESQVNEKERLLRTRDTEVNGFRRQLSELDAAKEQMESRFQEELGKLDQDRRAKEDIINDLEQRLGTSLHALRNEVGEKDLLLQARDGELKALNSEVKAISLRLSEMAAAKVRTEESLGEELRKEKHQREADKTAFREKEEHLDKEIHVLTTQLNERNEALKSRDGDIKSFKQEVKAVVLRLDELSAAKERAEALLQKELQEERQQREAKELASRELEERYGKQVQSLKTQLGEKEAFLTSRNEEIKSLKIQVDSLAEQMSKVGSAKERAASLLQQKLRKEKRYSKRATRRSKKSKTVSRRGFNPSKTSCTPSRNSWAVGIEKLTRSRPRWLRSINEWPSWGQPRSKPKDCSKKPSGKEPIYYNRKMPALRNLRKT